MRPYDLIVFDWDGTLFDSTALIARCIQQAVMDVGVSPPTDDQASQFIGLGLMEALSRAAPNVPEEKHQQLIARYHYHFSCQQDALTLFDGVLELLLALKEQHYWVAIATGKSRRGLDMALSQEVVVAGHGVPLRSLFDGSRSADQTQGKPNPQMLLELMREFGAQAARTLMVGDTTYDLEMARNAGVGAVGVSYGAHAVDDLQMYAPLALVHSVAQLRAWLNV